MPKVSPSALKEVQDAFEQYQEVVETSPLKLSAKNTYLLKEAQ